MNNEPTLIKNLHYGKFTGTMNIIRMNHIVQALFDEVPKDIHVTFRITSDFDFNIDNFTNTFILINVNNKVIPDINKPVKADLSALNEVKFEVDGIMFKITDIKKKTNLY